MDHPYSFVLHECEYLKEWFSDGESFRIALDDIPDDVISFTIGDSCAQITHGKEPAVLTKQMLIDAVSRFDSPEEYLKAVLGKFAYIEVQLWTLMDDNTK